LGKYLTGHVLADFVGNRPLLPLETGLRPQEDSRSRTARAAQADVTRPTLLPIVQCDGYPQRMGDGKGVHPGTHEARGGRRTAVPVGVRLDNGDVADVRRQSGAYLPEIALQTSKIDFNPAPCIGSYGHGTVL